MLFSTITCDLAARFPHFKASISQAIEMDPSVVTAGLTRQFEGLITHFSVGLPQDRPIVIVLDALDEGFSKELLQILSVGFCKLPGAFKIFVTSRDIDEVRQLLEALHVHWRKFDHVGGSGLDLVYPKFSSEPQGTGNRTEQNHKELNLQFWFTLLRKAKPDKPSGSPKLSQFSPKLPY